MFVRLSAACFTAVLVSVLSFSHVANAATLSSVDVDRSVSIGSGTGFLSSVGTGLSVAGFGPTVMVTDTSTLLFPSILVTGEDEGSVSFTGLGFPPAVVLGGTILDTETSIGLLEILFETAGGDFFALDIASSAISGVGFALNAPFVDPAASLTVFSAEDQALAPIPLPASGWLLASLILYLGSKSIRLRSA